MPAIEVHAAKLGRILALSPPMPGSIPARTAGGERQRRQAICIPNRASKSAARKREQKKRWFRDGQRWRTGCEGRISVSKRRLVSSAADIAAMME